MPTPSTVVEMPPSEPSSELLGLLDAFLKQHGLNSTSRALEKELKRKQSRAGWSTTNGVEGTLSLQAIFEQWKEKEIASQAQSSDPDSSAESTSTSGLNDSSSSASESSSDSESAVSEASSDDESETSVGQAAISSKKAKPLPPVASVAKPASSLSRHTKRDAAEAVGVWKAQSQDQGLKRKERALANESSSASDSDSSDDQQSGAKRIKLTKVGSNANGAPGAKSAPKRSVTSSSASSDSESSSDAGEDSQKLSNANLEAADDSQSSGTIIGDGPDDASSKPSGKKTEKASIRKKHVGAKPTPLAQLSASGRSDGHVSNAYQSYAYADRAYNDLSVTRGKGFTKEKNKKKRGSYRGGAIDISGGKGFKFDD